MDNSKVIIDCKNLYKTYLTRKGQEVRSLEDISFQIKEGEFVSVVGPSGCGKSTLLKIIGGLLDKTSGEVIIDGTPVENPRKDVGIVFQESLLLPWNNVLSNILIKARVFGLDMKEYRQKAMDHISLVGIEGFEDKYPFELSGGMQQRVSICRALTYDPALMLMDEPFGALDAMTRETMNLELLRIWGKTKKTIFFITHSITEAIFLSDRVIVITPRPGKIQDIVEVNLPRHRTFKMMGTETFTSLATKIRGYIGGTIE